MPTATTEIIIKAVDKFSREIGTMSKSLGGFKTKLNAASGASKAFAVGLTGVAVGVGALAKSAINAAAEFEQSQIAFTTMLGSAEDANKLLGELADFAKKTPFELTGIEGTAKQLLAMGIETDNLLPTLKSLGDVSAGLSVPIERLALNFGQVKAQGKLTGRELRDFAISGVPLLAQLADQFGVNKTEIQDMVTDGLVGFDDVNRAFQDMTSTGGKFNNLMEAQSGSLNGMISNLKDAWNLFLRGEGAALIDWGKQFVGFVINLVENVLPAWIVKIKQIISWFQEHKAVLIIVAGAIVGALIPAIWAAVSAFATLAITLAPFMLGGAVIAGLVAGIIWLVKNWDLVIAKAKQFWADVKLLYKLGMKFLKDEWVQFWNDSKQIVLDAWNNILDTIKSKINSAISLINSFIAKTNRVSGKLRIPNIPSIPALAEGGIVTRPTLALIGEAGPEAVVPLNRANKGVGGGNIVINITGNTLLDDDAGEVIGDMIIQKLQLSRLLA